MRYSHGSSSMYACVTLCACGQYNLVHHFADELQITLLGSSRA